MLRGKNVIGSSSMAAHVLISHRVPHPTFAEHAFRYLYESAPPHGRAGKFMLQEKRLKTICSEAAAAAGELNVTEACATRPLTLWVAFKCRATAVTQLTFLARHHRGSGSRIE